ncbi:MAG: RHS repeat protein, partial [Alphaproteobacteria bacterium]|nr:RHS repeat protein [Alphaproteobacteria bacterium]
MGIRPWRHLLALLVVVLSGILSLLPAGMARAQTFCGTTLPPEILTQAAALKNDPDLIYEYVYNTIQTLPQYGSLKGPLGTLLDGAGTPVDQAELMVSLLQAAGYGTAEYETGNVLIQADPLTAWLGPDNSEYSAAILMTEGGFNPNFWINPDTTLAYMEVPWAWVKVQIGGTYYVFDPATKAYNRSSGIANLAGAMGYSQASFLTSAETGATLTPTSIKGLNRANVRGNLATYSGNLVSTIKANTPAASPSDIVGGTTIVPLTVGTHQRIPSLPNLYPGDTPTDYPCLPQSLRTTLSLTVPGTGAVTFNTSDIYGHRLSLFFNGSVHPVLALDGVVQATGAAATPGSQVTLTTAITHPYLSNPGVNVAGDTHLHVTASATGAFVISNGWGQVGRGMNERHRVLLQQNTAQNPGNPGAEPVLGESLTMIGFTWLGELARVQALTDQTGQTSTIFHHAVGIVGMKAVGSGTGPFLDLPLNMLSITQRNNRPNVGGLTPIETAVFTTDALMFSALESGTIEQTQPGGSAVSTTGMIDWLSQSTTIYDLNNGTVPGDTPAYYTSTLRPLLATTWNAGDLGRVDSLVYSQNLRVIAPLIGNTTIHGLWTGTGYLATDTTANWIYALITGGLSGGEATYVTTVVALVESTVTSAVAAVGSTITSIIGTVSSAIGSLGTIADPVNRVTGSFTYHHGDLSVGSAPFPLGLEFRRSYDSAVSRQSGPLGPGWTHNFAIRARPDSDGFEGLAANSPINGASAIATLYVLQDLLNQGSSAVEPLDRIVIAAQAGQWLSEQLTGHVVVVTQPENVSSFTLLADGSYNPPFGSADTLNLASGTYGLTRKDGTVIAFNSSTGTAPGAIASWHDPAGPTVSFGYTSGGLLSSVSTGTGSSGTGRSLAFSYNGSNQLTGVADGTGRSVTYLYDASGNLQQATDPAGAATTYAYDPANPGRMTQYFKPSFPTIPFLTNSYDALGRVLTQTDAGGNATTLHFAGTRTEVDDALGNAQVLYFSPRGKALIDIDALGNPTVNTYDGQDRLVSTTAPEGNRISYTYDTRNNPLTVTTSPKPGSGLSEVTRSLTYDPLWNKVATVTDPLGLITQNTYDAATGTLTRTLADYGHLGATRSYTYNARGQVLTATDPLGVVTRYGYDGTTENQLSVVRDAGGAGHINQTTAFAYDAVGNVVSRTDPDGHATSFTCDWMRRPLTVTAPPPFDTTTVTTYGYDLDGRVTRI